MLLSVTLCLQQACMSQESDTCKLVLAFAVVREIPSLLWWISNLSA